MLINVALLGQIIYYGVCAEGKSLMDVLMADVSSSSIERSNSDIRILVGEDEESSTDLLVGPSPLSRLSILARPFKVSTK